jgi:hypothetical protein
VASATRLFAILARASRRAVVLRRGPSKQVALVGWDRTDDSFEVGQWLKGRIYERRCDLSPAGHKLVYFAASWKGPLQTWTAVSRPPWLTAVALWPKGDAWGGGGEFVTETRLRLNHRVQQTKLAEGFSLPKHVTVEPLGEASGRGEDFPLYGRLLERGGWRVVDVGKAHPYDDDGEVRFRYDPPYVVCKSRPGGASHEPELRMLLHGMGERGGPWYVLDHEVRAADGSVTALKRSDWADWDTNGDLLFARGGSLFRLRPRGKREVTIHVADAKLLADFSSLRFEARPSPPEAKRW